MNYSEFRKIHDMQLNGNGYSVTISAALRSKFRRAVRLLIIIAGGAAGGVGVSIILSALVRASALVPVLICAVIFAYTARMVTK